ncbi:antibiotic biosynthesis monooxygenase family protein [Curvivirga aplysinae]|uniref:antibiotic biosynthesis monooxygenase family protein n=1 Tax=Curvivirga aplysinae TaxID=2529852 RepID=UPI0012BC154A|nr:hypothetical protein [Curvivirga aplysinae]MTI09983.1 hypothetical protein [Curvivirga aplysinae]
MTDKVFEIVRFKLAEGVQENDFIKTTEAVTTYLKNCKGFITRYLSKSEDNIWLEYIEWDNMENAKAASKDFMQQESIQPYLQSLDADSVHMSHQNLLLKVG